MKKLIIPIDSDHMILQTATGKMPPFRVAYESSRSHP